MNKSWVIYDFSHMFICLLWFCHGLPKGEIVRTYVFHMLRTYVIILCNWLILWQNALYLYLDRLRMFKYFKKPRFKIKCWSLQVSSRNQVKSAISLKLDSWSITSRHLLSIQVYLFQNSTLIFLRSVNLSLGFLFS